MQGRARRRRLALVTALALGVASLWSAACGSDAPVDASDGGSGLTDGAVLADGALIPPSGGDGGALPPGRTCNPVPGPCDLVLQDCPTGERGEAQECVVGRADDGGYATTCRPAQPEQQLPLGRACCTSGGGNPCLPGLVCTGGPCDDGGAITGRCSPVCCPGEDGLCGRSSPEGIAGSCNLLLSDGTGETIFQACTYRERCRPFRLEPCGAKRACVLDDRYGSSSCVAIRDGVGKPPGSECRYANECQDGTLCVGDGTGGRCRSTCLTPGAVTPFDAGALPMGPGTGGCPAGEECSLLLSRGSFPAWISLCRFADGG